VSFVLRLRIDIADSESLAAQIYPPMLFYAPDNVNQVEKCAETRPGEQKNYM
jgi:hypothetical protein